VSGQNRPDERMSASPDLIPIEREAPVPAAFRSVMAGLAASVSIVTVESDGRTLGVTISSLVSLSLDPPLVLFALHERSGMLQHLDRRRFGITVLDESQRHIAAMFAARDHPPAPPEWLHRPVDRSEAVCILGGVVRLTAVRYACWQAGDHVIVAARVIRAVRGDASRPLLHFDRDFTGLAKSRDYS